jgi:hypothetical protein
MPKATAFEMAWEREFHTQKLRVVVQGSAIKGMVTQAGIWLRLLPEIMKQGHTARDARDLHEKLNALLWNIARQKIADPSLEIADTLVSAAVTRMIDEKGKDRLILAP